MTEGNIITENFLLTNKKAVSLYHGYAKDLPVIDFHNHLSPLLIAEDRKFENLTDIWLKGDHYKWRAMRAMGIDEELITGKAGDAEKFKAWAGVVPSTLRNPLFHWTHMELKNPFGIETYLNTGSAEKIYQRGNELLLQDEFSARSLLRNFNVEMLSTTDDPCDALNHHQQLAQEGFEIKVKPTFRPDKVLMITSPGSFKSYLKLLGDKAGIEITDIDSLLEALKRRVDFFAAHQCSIADHGISVLPGQFALSAKLVQEFKVFLKSDQALFSNPDAFAGFVLTELCKMYHEKGWVQQFHLGAIRNNNKKMFHELGADAGFDSIGDYRHAGNLNAFLSQLNKTDQLAKTIVYNLNPSDFEMIATTIGNFADGRVKGKMQLGSGWWFLDQKDGIERQLNALSNMGIVGTFVGMLTDSRSFLSYSRHEYFRRILCNLFGSDMDQGLLPDDEQWVGQVIQDICYYNAKNYFGLNQGV
ncbi:glucuronate isomerase [Pedobacter cryoconitis]|uniref:Uronate isomerase n=1 Tax=Pedobacter cryoconitis TaxID=188932 RepID=A0A7X0MK21_9SPHI|nr:glucuronate isomerase [Pedobacter cryoconitis]MBB6501739.1 glucuronate isomerase [Pedobacter cryoconitis]